MIILLCFICSIRCCCCFLRLSLIFSSSIEVSGTFVNIYAYMNSNDCFAFIFEGIQSSKIQFMKWFCCESSKWKLITSLQPETQSTMSLNSTHFRSIQYWQIYNAFYIYILCGFVVGGSLLQINSIGSGVVSNMRGRGGEERWHNIGDDFNHGHSCALCRAMNDVMLS